MISKEEVKKLADLARINISDTEAENFGKQIEEILEYVGTIQKVVSGEEEGIDFGHVHNVLREDQAKDSGLYREEIIAEFPEKQDDFLKVKKILSQE